MSQGLRTRALNAGRAIFKLPALESLACRLAGGRTPDSLLARVPPNHYQYAPGTMRRAERHGVVYDLDLSDYTQWAMYFDIRDPAKELLLQTVAPGEVVIDIGANIGELSMRFARRVGEHGQVVGFEPFPSTFEVLQRNLDLNRLPNVSVWNVAIGGVDGYVEMMCHAGNAGENRVASEGGDGFIPVEAKTLDSFLEANPIPRIDLIKIDTEGYEMRVLDGAVRTIARHLPRLFIEVNDDHLREYGATAESVLGRLESWGYSMVRPEDGRAYNSASDLAGCHLDLLAVPGGPGVARTRAPIPE